METYNSLRAEFNAITPSEDTQLHFKVLSDELKNNRNRRKMHYLIRKNQLKSLLNEQESVKSFRISTSMTSRSHKVSSVNKFEWVSDSKQTLKREISQIQHQIQFIRKQTNLINKQLHIYEKKKQELEVLRKRSQLDMFNSRQQLYIEAANINSQEHREQQIISLLKKNKGQIIGEINGLVKQRELSEKIINKWKSSKIVKIKTVKQLGVSPFILKEMITTMFGLHNLQRHVYQKIKYQKTQSQIGLNFSKTINKKKQIISALANHQLVFSERFASQMISFYKQLQQDFDRNQRANKQINTHLQILHQSHQKISKQLEKAYLNKQKQNQLTLQQFQKTLEQYTETFEQKCKLVTFFSTKFYQLLKKLNSLKKSIWNILLEANSSLSIRQIENQDCNRIIHTYQEYLYRNPQEIQIKWSESIIKAEFYKNYICQNDLLRTFSSPEAFSNMKEQLDNFETFLIGCSRNINQLIKNMSCSLKSYFKTTKNRLDDIFTERDNVSNLKDFCVQSKQYHRRDDFKLLQKMQKNELRKKGLLLQIPFNINAQNQLIINRQNIKNDKSFESLSTSRKLRFRKNQLKYSTLATKREDQSDLKCSSLRKMLSKLDSFRTKSSSKLFNRSTLNTSFNPNQSIQNIFSPKNEKLSTIRLPRNTVGTMQRLNTTIINNFG